MLKKIGVHLAIFSQLGEAVQCRTGDHHDYLDSVQGFTGQYTGDLEAAGLRIWSDSCKACTPGKGATSIPKYCMILYSLEFELISMISWETSLVTRERQEKLLWNLPALQNWVPQGTLLPPEPGLRAQATFGNQIGSIPSGPWLQVENIESSTNF